jgi:transcriptional regulator with XRE-family HTH domain
MPGETHKPLSIPKNRQKLIERAVSVDDAYVSVGGLAARLGLLNTAPTAESAREGLATTIGIATLARLVQLARRRDGLTLKEFSAKFGLNLGEMFEIENGRGIPEPRVLQQVSVALRVSYEKLLILAGHRRFRDENLDREALKFAANSGPMDKLSKAESQALQDFMKVLND